MKGSQSLTTERWNLTSSPEVGSTFSGDAMSARGERIVMLPVTRSLLVHPMRSKLATVRGCLVLLLGAICHLEAAAQAPLASPIGPSPVSNCEQVRRCGLEQTISVPGQSLPQKPSQVQTVPRYTEGQSVSSAQQDVVSVTYRTPSNVHSWSTRNIRLLRSMSDWRRKTVSRRERAAADRNHFNQYI